MSLFIFYSITASIYILSKEKIGVNVGAILTVVIFKGCHRQPLKMRKSSVNLFAFAQHLLSSSKSTNPNFLSEKCFEYFKDTFSKCHSQYHELPSFVHNVMPKPDSDTSFDLSPLPQNRLDQPFEGVPPILALAVMEIYTTI